MPIRPENKARYPKGWKAISRRIRFSRADGRCECRGECGTDHNLENIQLGLLPVFRCYAFHGETHPVTDSVVVLTTAHLNHTPEHCHDSNLRAMCQRCHLRYDADMKAAGRKERARHGNAVGDLFD